jgi:type II secretory pathway component PulM
MTEQPAPRRVERRIDESAADMGTLADMGHGQRPPVPAAKPLPGPSPTEQANEAALQAALTEAGVTKSGRDEQAIDILAKLDPADVEAVTRWLQTKKDTDK